MNEFESAVVGALREIRDEMRNSSLHRLIGVVEELKSKVDHILEEQQTMADAASQFVTDVATLTAAVQANTAVLQQIETNLTADAATITDLQSQIAALKAAGTVDPTALAALEAGITALQANNASGTAALTPAQTATAAATVTP